MKEARLDLRLPALDEKARAKLDAYVTMLLNWKKAINIVGAKSRAEIMSTLVPDCFWLASFMERLLPANWHEECWDFGAGAGLPGIPLRMKWQAGSYWMIEAREKRALFLANALANLNLPGTFASGATVESFLQQRGGSAKAGCIVSRAFMPWEKLLEYCQGMLSPAGRLVIMSSQPPPEILAKWRLDAWAEYPSGAKTRYIWALAPEP